MAISFPTYTYCTVWKYLKLCQVDPIAEKKYGKNGTQRFQGPISPGQPLGYDMPVAYDMPVGFDMDYPSLESIARGSNRFSANVYDEIAKDPGNQLFCAVSLHIILGFVLHGTGGQTSKQLIQALGMNGTGWEIMVDYLSAFTSAYQSTIRLLEGKSLKMVSKLYLKPGIEINKLSKIEAQRYFQTDIENINFADPYKAASLISKYVAERTDNKIRGLIKPDMIDTQAVLDVVNAVYFKATLEKGFESTYDGIFKVSNTNQVPIKMMAVENIFEYKDDTNLNAKILRLHFDRRDYCMIFILPNAVDGLPSVEAKLSKDYRLDRVLEGLEKTRLKVEIPKFRMQSKSKLKKWLTKIGIRDLFDHNAADLSRIAKGDGIFVSDIFQESFIEINENGTVEAGAKGLLGSDGRALPVDGEFVADHPFSFIILYNPLKIIAFRGRLINPN